MKKGLLFVALLGFIVIGSGCKKEADPTSCNLPGCDVQRPTVKKAVSVTGFVWYNTAEQKYAVYVGEKGSYDAQDVCLVCDMPEDFRKEGIQILFSGDYKQYCGTPAMKIPGQTYYYLHFSFIELQKDN